MSNTPDRNNDDPEKMRSEMSLAGFKQDHKFSAFRPKIKVPVKRNYATPDSTQPELGSNHSSPMKAIVVNTSYGNNLNSGDYSPGGRYIIKPEDIVQELYGPSAINDDDVNLSLGPAAKRLSLSPPGDDDATKSRGVKREAVDDGQQSSHKRSKPFEFAAGIKFREAQTYRVVYSSTTSSGEHFVAINESTKAIIDRIVALVLEKIKEFCEHGDDKKECMELNFERDSNVAPEESKTRSFVISITNNEEFVVRIDKKNTLFDIPAKLADNLPAELPSNENQTAAFNELFCHFIQQIFRHYGAMESSTGVMSGTTVEMLKAGEKDFKIQKHVDADSRAIIRETMQNHQRLTGVFGMCIDEPANTLDFKSSLTVCRAMVVKNEKYVSSVIPLSTKFYIRQPDYQSWDGVLLLVYSGQLVYFSKKSILASPENCRPDIVFNN